MFVLKSNYKLILCTKKKRGWENAFSQNKRPLPDHASEQLDGKISILPLGTIWK